MESHTGLRVAPRWYHSRGKSNEIISLVARSKWAASVARGGEGEGPGEFRSVSKLGLNSSGLWVIDGQRPIAQFFSYDLRHQKSVTLPFQIQANAIGGLSLHATVGALFGEDGIIVSVTSRGVGGALATWLGGSDDDVVYFLVGYDGVIRNRIGVVEHANSCQLGGNDGRVYGSITIPFCRDQLRRIASNGEFILFLRDHARTERNTNFEMTLVRTNGDTVYSHLNSYSQMPIGPTQLTSANAELQRLRGAMRSLGVKVSNTDLPSRYPAFEDAMISVDGQARWSNPEEDATWWRFSANGTLIGKARLSQASRIVGAYRNTIWVELTDEYDVPSLARYRISYE